MKTASTVRRLIKVAMFAALLIVGSAFVGTSAQAQGWRGPRVVVVPRVRFFAYPAYPYPVYPYGYPYGPSYYSYSPRYDAGPYDVAEPKGYHDGFNRGREDARDGRIYDPNNSSHFRESISGAYREGFRRGYAEGYRRPAG